MSWTRRALLIGGSAAALGCGGLGTPKRRSKPVPEEAPPGRGQMRELKDRVNGLDRTAQLYVPSRYDPDTPTPIVLGTHGRGGTSRTVYSGFGWRDACERHGWLGLFPYSGREVRTESNDNAWLDHLLTRCTEELNIDRARVWGSGFSGGCHRQYAFAVAHDWLCAIAVVGGAISHGNNPDGEDPVHNHSKPISVLHVHGLMDRTIPFDGGSFKSPEGKERTLLSVRDGLMPWIENIGGRPMKDPSLPEGCPPAKSLQTERWVGKKRRSVQLVIDPELDHSWPKGWATDAFATWFEGLG